MILHTIDAEHISSVGREEVAGKTARSGVEKGLGIKLQYLRTFNRSDAYQSSDQSATLQTCQ